MVEGYDEEFRYSLRFDYGLGFAAENLEVSGSHLFAQTRVGNDQTGYRVDWHKKPPLTAHTEPGKILLNRLPGLEFATAALSTLTEGLGVYAFPLNVLARLSKDDVDSVNGSLNALSVIHSLWTNPQSRRLRAGVIAALRQLNSTISSVDLDSIQNPKAVVVGHEFCGSILPMPLASESSGFRRFLAHLLALYQTPPKQTLIFEEPENGIFPGALAVLAEEFRATPEAGRGQVILTTHNPVFLNYFEPHQIRVVELDDNLETQIGPLAADQQESIREKLMDAGELFTTDRPRREVVAQ